MRSTTLQFVVAGALIAAWAWMLGRPLLMNLFRRSRRDSVGHFRYQQAVLSQPVQHERRAGRSWADRPRPVADWRGQPVENRRLQLMLGFAIATFASMLLAIALRGPFVRLFLLMALSFAAYLVVAVCIGTVQLRRMEQVRSRQRAGSESARSTAREAGRREPLVPILEGSGIDGQADDVEPSAADPGPFGQGIFDEGFYEPIPELAFKPLNLDASIVSPSDEQDRPLPPAERDQFSPGDVGIVVEAAEVPQVAPEPAPAEPTDDAEDQPQAEVTFTAAPEQRARVPKRSKARPIYIESQLDDGRDVKAVND